MKKYLFVPLIGLITSHAFSQEIDISGQDLKLNLGGAIRTRFDLDPDRDIEEFGIDTVILNGRFSYKGLSGEIEYRLLGGFYPYQYVDNIGDISFPKKAFIKYAFDNETTVSLGLNQVPLGLQPFFGSTMIESLGYTMGIEDLYKTGVKFGKQFEHHHVDLGYYWDDAWRGEGTSNGTYYSNVITEADAYVVNGTSYKERNSSVVNYTYSDKYQDWNYSLGLSGYYAHLKDFEQNKGSRNLLGIHYATNNDKYGLKFVSFYQDVDINNKLISLGGYDGTFNMATKGMFYSLDLSYKVPQKYLNENITNWTLYSNYSLYDKTESDFKSTQRLVLGSSFFLNKNFYISTEWLFGKNDPYIGGSSYTQSLASGGTNHWENQLNIDIGYYF